ncbi:TFIIH/NER complex subunit [Friedmanniomyces endolithicus]|nr:TFIIH/NER complex subunit [Friedmanniomyces endolithicus]KAK0805171.1 TFIIH/NER complex subunit [Friedmanniomyces endolithicus]KAK0814450.1 TFIIH/NER complex subunit [Friedmanniomyces endolithicus]KAK0818400.1 TFIIH/NER complex subunit [Friedmanniomyces endolithicus]KAK0856080.1 TFIIH/NER complex subunit [Friedmanniomyces endolithicus]
MSRIAPPKVMPVYKRDPRTGVVQSQDDVCPVCKSARYMNPSLRFLVNPECYHKMCESCVDRMFSHGPAACPIKGCGRTLRKHRFREQTFEDIKVEREVDIRKKVGATFNRREEDFETLLAYNDYLNDVEDITFNLINGIDLEETNKKFEAYTRAHGKEIEENAQMAVQERQSFSAAQKLERQQARERREAARREEEEEKREVEENRRDVLNRLASGADAETVAKEGQRVQLKKRMDRQAATERQRQLQAAEDAHSECNNKFVIKGLKTKQKPAPEALVDPFGGLRLVDSYFTLQDDYIWEGIQEARKDVKQTAGGYDVRDYAHRSLVAAFSGLGVFVADEITQRDQLAQKDGVVGEDVGLKDAEMIHAL